MFYPTSFSKLRQHYKTYAFASRVNIQMHNRKKTLKNVTQHLMSHTHTHTLVLQLTLSLTMN